MLIQISSIYFSLKDYDWQIFVQGAKFSPSVRLMETERDWLRDQHLLARKP